MRFRVSRALRDTVLPTLDGPLQINKDDVVIVAVVSDLDQAARLMRSIDTVDAPHPRKRPPTDVGRPVTNVNVIPRGKR